MAMTDFKFDKAKTIETLEVMVRGYCRKLKVEWLERHHSLRQAANFYAAYRPAASRMFDLAADRQEQLKKEEQMQCWIEELSTR